ncbi:hypothetical protein [Paenibacillus prosopidis]|uniref:hypothetical protein n=1 Tax=Paenibacillus prosopidis TaxID=630520 RepID=UPI0011C06F83|nr:hypothetical protein [Paenibacillus prosopidis]
MNGETNSLLAANEITVVGYDQLGEQVRTTIEGGLPETKLILTWNDSSMTTGCRSYRQSAQLSGSILE